jgi:hypothetical protein
MSTEIVPYPSPLKPPALIAQAGEKDAWRFRDEYITAAGIKDDKRGPLFRSAIGRTGDLSEKHMSRVDAWYMVRRRAKDGGIEAAIGNHSFRAIGITDYLERGGDINVPSAWPVTRMSRRPNSTTGAAMI